MAGPSSGVRRLAESKKPTKSKARKILKEGMVRGKALTGKQKRFFGHASNR